MVFKGFFGRERQPEAAASAVAHEATVQANRDGWVEMQHGHLVVHDPVGLGRYASLTPRGGVRLWVNDEEMTAPTVVQAVDHVRYQLPDTGAASPIATLVSPDGMAASARLLFDPTRRVDTVTVQGQSRAELWPAASPAAPREADPQALVIEALERAGITFGLDAAALDRLLQGPVGQEVVIAHGQAAVAPTPGHWEWLVQPNQMVEPGVLLVLYRPGAANRPQITVRGQESVVYSAAVDEEAVEAGEGTRAMAGGTRVVAGRAGRFDRTELAPGRWQITIYAAQYFPGDQVGLTLEGEGDVVIAGNLRGAQIRITGSLVVEGACQGCTLQAQRVDIGGEVSDCEILTMPQGHVAPLLPDYTWFAEQLRWSVDNVTAPGAQREEQLRVMLARLSALRKAAESLGLQEPTAKRLLEALTKVLVGVGLTGVISHGRALVGALEQLCTDAASVGGDIILRGSVLRCRIWAGGNLYVGGAKVNASYLYVAGDLESAAEAVWSQSEGYVGRHARVGVLSSVRGDYACSFRVGGHLTGQEILPGTIVEVGYQRQEFRVESFKIKVGLNARGEIRMQRLE